MGKVDSQVYYFKLVFIRNARINTETGIHYNNFITFTKVSYNTYYIAL